MKRFLSVFICILVIISSSSCSLIGVYAADEEYKTFLQIDSRWSGTPLGGSTIGSSGCAITSIAMLMAYADPSLRDVNKFNPASVPNQKIGMQGVATTWESLDPTWILVNPRDYAYSEQETIEKIKAAIDNDYYVMIGAASHLTPGICEHYSPVVGIDNDGKPVLWDVSAGENTWRQFMEHAFIEVYKKVQIVTYKSTINPSRKALYNGSIEVSDSDEELSEEQEENIANMLKECELHGMPINLQVMSNGEQLEFGGYNDLSLDEKLKMRDIESSKRRLSALNVMNITMIVTGILCLAYASVLIIAVIFDKTNNFFDLQLVNVLTLGKVNLVNPDELKVDDERRKEGYVSARSFLVGVIILFLLGIFLVSGIFTRFLLSLLGPIL